MKNRNLPYSALHYILSKPQLLPFSQNHSFFLVKMNSLASATSFPGLTQLCWLAHYKLAHRVRAVEHVNMEKNCSHAGSNLATVSLCALQY